jgi:hypothetical protein
MITRVRRDTDDEIYIYINEEDELLKWNWDNDVLEKNCGEIQYCCIAFCFIAGVIVLFVI